MTQAIKFSNPEFSRLGAHIESAALRTLPMVKKDMHEGARGALICAQGPSILKPGVMRSVRRYARLGWTVFGIKEAIAYLVERGIAVHYSVAMDPGAHQVGRTPVYPDIVYCIASSCHPELFDHVLGGGAKVLVYHSACGWAEREIKPGFVLELGSDQTAIVLGAFEMRTTDGAAFTPVCSAVRDEVEVYRSRFPCADVIVGGFTVGNRALGLAKYMGFKRVVVAGLDFGWREGRDDRYAGFVDHEGLRDVFMSDQGRVDGTPWKTRPDLLASAVDVARHIKRGEVKVLGDSLARSLAAHDDDYLDRVVRIEH
jgi:hypothetical protein